MTVEIRQGLMARYSFMDGCFVERAILSVVMWSCVLWSAPGSAQEYSPAMQEYVPAVQPHMLPSQGYSSVPQGYLPAMVGPPQQPVTPYVVGPVVPNATGTMELPMPGAVITEEGVMEMPVVPPPPIDGLPWLPNWIDPFVWFAPALWEGSFEIGINGQQGNAETFNLQTGFDFSRETERSNWDLDLIYAKNDSGGVETQHNALLTSNWDYKLARPRWSWFNKLLLEYDEFKQFDLRLALTTGLGYLFVDNDRTQLRGRVGFGTSKEFDSPDDEWKAELALGADFTHRLTNRQKLYATADYYPNLSDFSDYRVVVDAGWEYLLDQPTNLSLKLGILDRYDSTPGDSKANDFNYTLLLIWKT